MKKLYIAAMIAFKGTKWSMCPGYVITKKESTAMGEMLIACKKEYPPNDGWENHQVAVGHISDSITKQIGAT